LDKRNKYNNFIRVRGKFEEFLLTYDYLIQQMTRKYRGAYAAIPHVVDLYFEMMNMLSSNPNINHAVEEIIQLPKFNHLTLSATIEEKDIFSNFTTDSKSEVFIKEAIKNGLRCGICNGFIHKNAMTIDHVIRKEEGGKGIVDNGQITHPYCIRHLKLKKY
jgi:5-methylcytosine-specific restriction endonuclease McrA